MTTIPADEIRPGDVVVHDGRDHRITHVDRRAGWAWPIAVRRHRLGHRAGPPGLLHLRRRPPPDGPRPAALRNARSHIRRWNNHR